jgi:hypothetical protein
MKTVVIDVPERWIAASVAPRRQVDVGHPTLIYVTVIDVVEAARINVDFKRQAEETLRVNLAEEGEGYIGKDMDELAVQGAARWTTCWRPSSRRATSPVG